MHSVGHLLVNVHSTESGHFAAGDSVSPEYNSRGDANSANLPLHINDTSDRVKHR